MELYKKIYRWFNDISYNVTTVIFVPTNSIVVLTTGIYVEFTNMVNNINYVCGWYQNNHKLIILTTFFVEKWLLFFSVYILIKLTIYLFSSNV